MEIERSSGDGDGDGEGADAELGLPSGGMYLVWQDLSVVIPNFGNVGPTKRLIQGLNGYAQPGKIMAIMGPSGSGKSTLLDSLAGRLARNVVMTGNIYLNGNKRRLNYGGVAYVTQDNVLLGTLTVKETITYSAQLRLPNTLTKKEVDDIVQATITEMGLQDCSDRLIGTWHLRGLSGGEKKRVSIAIEILTRPRLLFLDEPTTGLDSASAFFIVQTLKTIACDGRTVISSIHQPSSEVFELFDHLFLLSGGQTVYFGGAQMAVEFFAESGFPCPTRRSPSDHFLRCINSDFDAVTATLIGSNRLYISTQTLNEAEQLPDPLADMLTEKIKATLIEKFKWSRYATIARARILEILAIEGLETGRRTGSEAGWWRQLATLTRRSSVNMSRDVGYYWIRLIVYILLAISVGAVFFDVGTSFRAIRARGACGAFISGFMTFMSIGGFPSFIEEMKVFERERLNGHYGVAVYTLSNFLSSFPFLAMMSLSTGSITYYMVKFRPGFHHFVYVCLDFTAAIAVVESCMMIIASVVPNYLMGIIVGAGYIGIMMMTSGYFRLQPDLPKIFWRYPMSYLNYGAYALEGAYKNDMIGLEFDSEPDEPKLKGDFVLKWILGINVEYSKWWDLTVVVIILITYRLFFFAILKFKEKVLPVFQALYVKRTLHNLKKRASFRKIPSFPSLRQKNIPPMTSQEGLNSPIH